MSWTDLFKDAFPLMQAGAQKVTRWVVAHSQLLIVGIVLGLLVWVSLFIYQKSFQKEIVLLTGPPGSSSWRSGENIADEIRKMPQLPGLNYAVRLEVTDGFEESEARIGGDREGIVVGFLQNRAKEAEGIRTLLPLDYDYLHILCRTGFITDHLKEAKGVYTFGDVLRELKEGRVFAGPPGSGTRQLAARIFARYGKRESRFASMLNPSIHDWLEGRIGLQQGTIDVLFYMGPIGSTTIEEIALQDQSAVLVDIDEIVDALVQHEGFSVYPVAFPRNCYRAGSWEYQPPSPQDTQAAAAIRPAVDTLRGNAPREFWFCPVQVNTIAARRLFVGSERLAPYDAYQIGEAVKKAIPSNSREVGEWEAQPPLVTKTPPKDAVGIARHPGTKGPPSKWWNPRTWSPFWVSTSSTALVLLAAQFLSAARSYTERTKTSPPTGGAAGRADGAPAPEGAPPNGQPAAGVPIVAPARSLSPPVFDEEQAAIKALVRALAFQTEPFGKQQWSQKESEIRKGRARIVARWRDGDLTEDQARTLLTGLREALSELDLLKEAAARPGNQAPRRRR